MLKLSFLHQQNLVNAIKKKKARRLSYVFYTVFQIRPLLLENFGPTNPVGFVGPENLSVLVEKNNVANHVSRFAEESPRQI